MIITQKNRRRMKNNNINIMKILMKYKFKMKIILVGKVKIQNFSSTPLIIKDKLWKIILCNNLINNNLISKFNNVKKREEILKTK